MLVVAAGAGAELATRKRLARAACRGHTVHPPAALAEINDNGNTAAVGAADNYPGPRVRIRTCHEPSCPRGGGVYSVQCQYDQ